MIMKILRKIGHSLSNNIPINQPPAGPDNSGHGKYQLPLFELGLSCDKQVELQGHTLNFGQIFQLT